MISGWLDTCVLFETDNPTVYKKVCGSARNSLMETKKIRIGQK